jgi:hypothetical protein
MSIENSGSGVQDLRFKGSGFKVQRFRVQIFRVYRFACDEPFDR